MNRKLTALILGVEFSVVGATCVVAHHSFAAEYDASRPVTVKGVVTRVEWTNPHAHCSVAAKDDEGHVTTWTFELASPRVLATYGWKATSLRVGDEVTIDGAIAKDGSPRANARAVTLVDGRRLSAASSGGDLSSK